jgi:hypothetical protein
MDQNETLDKFGKFVINVLRDKQIDHFNGLIEGKWRSKKAQRLYHKLSKFDRDEKKVIADVVEDILTNATHDLLFAIQVENSLETGLKVMMDNKNVAELSDGLHGELFEDQGWIQRFSKYQPLSEEDPSGQPKSFMNKWFGKS